MCLCYASGESGDLFGIFDNDHHERLDDLTSMGEEAQEARRGDQLDPKVVIHQQFTFRQCDC